MYNNKELRKVNYLFVEIDKSEIKLKHNTKLNECMQLIMNKNKLYNISGLLNLDKDSCNYSKFDIAFHLKNIYASRELDKNSTTENFSVVQKEGRRKTLIQIDTKYRKEFVQQLGWEYK